jgi:hypothetical protein
MTADRSANRARQLSGGLMLAAIALFFCGGGEARDTIEGRTNWPQAFSSHLVSPGPPVVALVSRIPAENDGFGSIAAVLPSHASTLLGLLAVSRRLSAARGFCRLARDIRTFERGPPPSLSA